MPTILIVGATRGLGASLAKAYATKANTTVFGTTRSASNPKDFPENVKWVNNIDLTSPECGGALVNQLGMQGVGAGMVDGAIKGFDVVVR